MAIPRKRSRSSLSTRWIQTGRYCKPRSTWMYARPIWYRKILLGFRNDSMIFSKAGTPASTRRRQLLEGAALSLGLAALPATLRAQQTTQVPLKAAGAAEVQAIIDAFLQGAQPQEEGLKLEMPILGDNPAAVPVKAMVELPM